MVWDRRGHSRSETGDGPGSRAEDAADLARLIEHVSGEPVHVAGNSYGANVTLTLLTERPDLVVSAAVHEPPLFGLLEGTRDRALASELSAVDADLAVVRDLISVGDHRDAAEYFFEHVALGPGAWAGLPDGFRTGAGGQRPHLPRRAGRSDSAVDRHCRIGHNDGASAADARHREPRALSRRDLRARPARTGGASGGPRGSGPHSARHPPAGLERSPRRVPRRECARHVAASAMWSAMTLSSSIRGCPDPPAYRSTHR